MFKRIHIILFIIITLGIYVLTLLQINGTFFLYGLGQILLGLLFLVTYIYSVIKVFRDKRQISLIKKLQPLIFGLFLILFFSFLSYFSDPDCGKKTRIQANIGGDLTFVNLNLWNDGTFKLFNSGPFGGRIYRGQYVLRNDTLLLDTGDLDLYPTLAFVIKKDTIVNEKYFDPVSHCDSVESFYKLYIQLDDEEECQ